MQAATNLMVCVQSVGYEHISTSPWQLKWNLKLHETVVFHICLNSTLVHQNHHFQKIFWAKYPRFPEFWRIWVWIREDCFHGLFFKPNYFNPSYCRTSFPSFPLRLFFFHLLSLSASSQFITMFTSECIHCHSVTSLENTRKIMFLLTREFHF